LVRLIEARITGADERIATAASEVSQLITTADRITFAVAVVTCVLALAIGVQMWLHIVAWLTRLQDGSGRIAQGDLTTRIEEEPGELGRVARTFNGMAQELAATMVRLEAARTEAERSNAAKTAVLRIVSHDLRDRMNSIPGYCGLVREGLERGDSSQTLTDLHEIEQASKRLLGFVNQFLDFSRLESGRMPVAIDEYEVETLVSEVLTTVKPLASAHGVTLETGVAPSAGWIRTDAMKVRQILVNLLGNACKFSHGGIVRLTVARRRDSVVFEVRDTGAGMTPDLMARVFQPFEQAGERTAEHYGGVGLGLAIAKGFCELLKGTITVSSTPGRGTVFVVELPSVTVVAEDTPRPSDESAADSARVTLAS
jgi:signal transduction histidine kinase